MSRAGRTESARPFWSRASAPAKQRLAGSWADLVGRAGAALVDVAGEIKVRTYDRAAAYEIGELVDHPTFGAGIVVGQPGAGKVCVRFCDRDRVLVAGPR